MREEHASPAPRHPDAPAPQAGRAARWQTPRVETIPLDCEISAYAPAGDGPLF